MTREIDRRSFLKGATLAGVSVAATGLAACAPSNNGASGKDDPTTSTPKQGGMTAEDVLSQKWSFEIPPDPVSEDKIVETITADVVIVGSGMSGLCAAASAIESGADVLVVTAGSKAVSRGGSNAGFGTKYQKELGIDASPATMSRFLRIIQYMEGLKINQRLWAKWINNSAESLDWLIDQMADAGLKVSLEFGCDDPDGILASPPHSHNFWNEENPNGASRGAVLRAAAHAAFFEKNGGTIHWNTPAKYLERDDNNTGRVSAVIAQRTETGKYVRFEARKAVVLATGDFARDKDMMAKYAPSTLERYQDNIPWGEVDYDGNAFAGDGHKMGLWVGAAWQKTYPAAPMEACGTNAPMGEGMGNFKGINLAADGRRFMNENISASFSANPRRHMVGDRVFYIWDSEYIKLRETWPYFGASIDGINGLPARTQEQELANWESRVTSGRWFKSDTLDGLLSQLEGLDVKTAKASIDTWNRHCEKGYDEEFLLNPAMLRPIKTGPFYGSFDNKATASSFLTICGGLRTNENMQVCEEDDTPIEGLYCTGIMTGDFYANDYGFAIFGQNLGGVCGTLSYLLGRDLAKL